MTIEELEKKVIELEEKYSALEYKYLKLREWSDDNDLWLREMIDALTETAEKYWDKFNMVFARLKDLENTVFEA